MGSKARPGRGGTREGAGRPRKPRNIAPYQAVGAPPEDTLERVKYAQAMLAVVMHDIANNEDIPDRERRKELRATAKVMADLVPKERIWDAERTIKEDMDLMDSPPDPEMKDAKKRAVTVLRK